MSKNNKTFTAKHVRERFDILRQMKDHDEIEAAMIDLKEQVDANYKRPWQQYGKLRKSVEALGMDQKDIDAANKIFRMTSGEYVAAQEGHRKAVEERNRNVTTFS